jgi:ribosomal protein S27E
MRRGVSRRIRDAIVPGSARTEHVEYDRSYITVRCGRCGHEQEVSIEWFRRTSGCRGCGRSIQIQRVLDDAAGDVIDAAEIEGL